MLNMILIFCTISLDKNFYLTNGELMRAGINPLVSICIPTYNGNEFIREALKSALAQTYSNTEIIISDDRSSDGTVKTVKEI